MELRSFSCVRTNMNRIAAILCFCFGFVRFVGQQLPPTHRDLRYSKKYERSTLDLWVVKGKESAPLVVYFHGGGFKFGDKAFFHRSSTLLKYQPRGVAFASVNYPYLKQVGQDYLKIMNHCAEAIRFSSPILLSTTLTQIEFRFRVLPQEPSSLAMSGMPVIWESAPFLQFSNPWALPC